jgi:hypothetical protein
MNEMNNYLFENNIILKEIEDITPKTRKKIEVYLGVDMKNNYGAIFICPAAALCPPITTFLPSLVLPAIPD